jgi:PAS domain S-box-containing protein
MSVQTRLPSALQAYVDSSPIALTYASVDNPDLPLIAANAPFLRLTGYDREEIVGRNCRFLQADLKDQPARERLRAFVKGDDENIRTTIVNFRKDGTPFINLLYMSRIRDGAGQDRLIFASQFDVSGSETETLKIYDARLREEIRQAALAAKRKGLHLSGTAHALANSAALIAQSRLALADV